uniref:(northern house mosquito) hypothetical protein n=1 Tax=Culex pipiens TaxID=7175 RepID=A0A8D8BVQ5_CULPI
MALFSARVRVLRRFTFVVPGPDQSFDFSRSLFWVLLSSSAHTRTVFDFANLHKLRTRPQTVGIVHISNTTLCCPETSSKFPSRSDALYTFFSFPLLVLCFFFSPPHHFISPHDDVCCSFSVESPPRPHTRFFPQTHRYGRKQTAFLAAALFILDSPLWYGCV